MLEKALPLMQTTVIGHSRSQVLALLSENETSSLFRINM